MEFAFTDVCNIDDPCQEYGRKTLDISPSGVQVVLRSVTGAGFSNVGERVLVFIRESNSNFAQLPARPTTFIALEPGFFEVFSVNRSA